MFGIEISNTIIDQCISAGGKGYIDNSKGKPAFSKEKTDRSLAIIQANSDSDLSVSEDVRAEMNENNLAYTIIGRNRDHSKSYLPDRYFENVTYENRIYIYGMLDCYTLIRDYFRDKLDIWVPANIDRSFGWWNSGRNLYVDLYKDYGFKETRERIEEGDVLLFSFNNGMPSHSAIYVGGGQMLHHMIGRFSCIEPFDGYYQMSLSGVLRHGTE